MNKITNSLLLAVVSFILFASPQLAIAASNAAPKLTGGVKYVAYDLARQADFEMQDAQDNRPVKGNFKYSDTNGNWYKVDIQAVKINNEWAYFAGPVVTASDPSWVGNWLSAAAYDGGNPGSKGDLIFGIFTDQASALANVSGMVTPGLGFAITQGNLTVH